MLSTRKEKDLAMEERRKKGAVKEGEGEGCLVGKREGNHSLVFRKKKKIAFSC